MNQLKSNILNLIIGIILLALAILIFSFIKETNKIIPISTIALIAGVMFEIKKINEDWKIVLRSAFYSFLGSFLVFLPGKKEKHYDIENRILIWPYIFAIIFIIITIVMNKKKVTAHLTEGTTLLLSIAVTYWTLDFFSKNDLNLFLIILFSIIGIFTLFSIFHAFTKTELTKRNRLILSIWSSVIFLLFALDNIYRVYQNNRIEDSDITNGCYIALQYFLLGVSSIYIVQNFSMLVGFMPSKHRFFNQQYFEDIQELKNDHIERYSESQTKHLYSSLCLIFTAVIFYYNYVFQIISRNVAIWAVFLIFPVVINLYEYMIIKSNEVSLEQKNNCSIDKKQS